VSDESNVSRLVEKVSISNDELGKRKLQNDLELDERRQTLAERRIQLQSQSIENDKQRAENDKQRAENDKQRAENRVSAVLKCTEAMTALDPSWKRDQRIVLQFQEVLANGFFHDSSTGAGNSGNTGGQMMAQSALASISIGQIALEMSVTLKHGDSVKIGKLLSRLYIDKHGQYPAQHKQLVQGVMRNINSYTEADRELVKTAIRVFFN